MHRKGKNLLRGKWIRYAKLLWYRTIKWLSEHISQRNYQILVSVAIGIVAGLAAVVLKYSVNQVRLWMEGNDPTQGKIGFVFFPVIGILLTVVYIRFMLRKRLDIGFSGLIYSMSQKKVNLPRFEMYAHTITSSLTVGLGGSVGLEAPIVRTGSAIGSNLARILRVGRNKQTLFLTCGAAAGMAAIFNSPVAAVIFAFEVLLTDIALPAFIPLLIAAATGAVTARFFYYERLFYLPANDWSLIDIPFFVLFGVFCGLYSTYILKGIPFFDRLILNLAPSWKRFVLGGLALGLLIFLMPPLFGEGYGSINEFFSGSYQDFLANSLFYRYVEHWWVLVLFALAVILAKAAATSLTLSLGGNGGVFAPSMFSGATLGFIFAFGINQLGVIELSVADFVAVGMAGILSGVIKSPLTGIFLIAEITGGYLLFVPLMIVSALSYFISYYFEPNSIFTMDLFRKGVWVPSHEKDKQLLKNMHLNDLIETHFAVLHPQDTLGGFVEKIAHSRRNVFPVTDEKGMFVGIVLLDDVRTIMFQPEKYETTFVSDLMHRAPAVLELQEPMEAVMDKFEQHQAWNLPVVDGGRYLGFVSKSSILGQYRQLLKERSGV